MRLTEGRQATAPKCYCGASKPSKSNLGKEISPSAKNIDERASAEVGADGMFVGRHRPRQHPSPIVKRPFKLRAGMR